MNFVAFEKQSLYKLKFWRFFQEPHSILYTKVTLILEFEMLKNISYNRENFADG